MAPLIYTKKRSPAVDQSLDTPKYSSSPLVGDETVTAVPTSSRDPSESDEDDNWQPLSHGRDVPMPATKRKNQAFTPEKEATDSTASSPTKKAKTKSNGGRDATPKQKSSPKLKKPKPCDATQELDRAANAEAARLEKPTNKHLKAMSKWGFINVDKAAAKVGDHRGDITTLKHQVIHLAPALDPTRDLDRDVDGKKNKFDYQKAREAVPERKISEWKGKKWTDENDDNITWFMVPASQKYLSFSGRMVPIQDILSKSPQFPEFDHMGDVDVEHPKTKKMVVGFHKITYEKMNPEQAEARMQAMIQKSKAATSQRKKDEAVERRRALIDARRVDSA